MIFTTCRMTLRVLMGKRAISLMSDKRRYIPGVSLMRRGYIPGVGSDSWALPLQKQHTMFTGGECGISRLDLVLTICTCIFISSCSKYVNVWLLPARKQSHFECIFLSKIQKWKDVSFKFLMIIWLMFKVQLFVHVLCTCIQKFLPYVKQEQELLYVMYPIE